MPMFPCQVSGCSEDEFCLHFSQQQSTPEVKNTIVAVGKLVT